MKLIGILLIIIVSFMGLAILIYTCSKNNYVFKYTSDKRKIEICPAKDKSLQTHG